jgi:Holliday junction resolvase RusA-like endonuclease
MREFQKQMTDVFENYKSIPMLEGKLLLDVTFEMSDKRSRDLDNLLKSLLDSLEGRVFKNDKDIFEINCRKFNNCDEFKTIIVVKELL